jgi:tellurite resistance protein
MLVGIGSEVYYRTLASGVFHCERCGGDRSYRHRTGRRWFAMFGLPVLPLERTGEHLCCTTCRTCYRVELLAVPTIEQMQAALLGATTAACLAMLAAGGPASHAARRRAIRLLISAGSPEDSESELAEALSRPGRDDDQVSWILAGPVPGLRSAIESLVVQLEMPAREWFLGRIVQVGLADGVLNAAERDVIELIARYLGLSQAQAREVIALHEESAQAG